MSEITVSRHHHLTPAEARAAVEEIALDLAREFPLQWAWDEDVVHFRSTGLRGEMVVAKGEVFIAVKLGLLLLPFRGALEGEIHRYFDRHFPADAGGGS